MELSELLNLLHDVEDQQNYRSPEGDDPRPKAAFAQHMCKQALRAEHVWRLVFTCDDFRDLPPAAADLLLRATVHAESACADSARTWKAQADYWVQRAEAAYPSRHKLDPPSPRPRD